MIMLTTSFMRAPWPVAPRNRRSFPILSRAGAASSKRSRSPPQRMIRVPSSAGFLVPETGASRNRPPAATIASPIAPEVTASTVDMST